MSGGEAGNQSQEQAKLKEVITGSATYEGETNGGMKHGMGTLTWDDGDQVSSFGAVCSTPATISPSSRL